MFEGNGNIEVNPLIWMETCQNSGSRNCCEFLQL